jgi:hypothetical protein
MESSMKAPQKRKIELLYHPVIPLPGIDPKECKSEYNADTCLFVFIATPLVTAQLWKQSRCPTTDEWSKKM